MLVSINELKKYVDLNGLTAEEIANGLTFAGIEVEEVSKEEYVLSKVNKVSKTIDSKNDILVEGIDEIKTNIASCCNPIPGDTIVGYISKGNGINIHRSISLLNYIF